MKMILINNLHRNLHKANFALEQRRGPKNVLISDNVINVHFCSKKKEERKALLS